MKFDKFYIYIFSFLILISDRFSAAQSKDAEKPFNLKIVPSRMNKLTLDDLDQIKMEVLHDMNSQLKDLEDDMGEKQRLKEKTSSSWSITGAPIYLPRDPNERGKMIPSKNKMYKTNSNSANEKFSQNLNKMLNFKELEDQLHEADEVLNDLKRLKYDKGKNKKINEKVNKNPEKDKEGQKSISSDVKKIGKVENVKINNDKSNSTKTKTSSENKISNFTKITESNKKPEYDEIDIKKRISETIEPFEKELKKLLNMNSFGNNLILKFNKTVESSEEDKNNKNSKASEKKEQKENEGAENKNDKKLDKEKNINPDRNEDNKQEYNKQKEQLKQVKKLNQELQKATREFEINEKASNKITIKNEASSENASKISAVPKVSHSQKKINNSFHNEKKENVTDLQKLTKHNENSSHFSLLEKKTVSGSEKIKNKNFNQPFISNLNMRDENFRLPDGPIDLGFMGMM